MSSRLRFAAPAALGLGLLLATPPASIAIPGGYDPLSIPLSSNAADQTKARVCADGTGGAILAWESGATGGSNIYVQRVDAAGSVQWTHTGIALVAAQGSQWAPLICADGVGGAYVGWIDARDGDHTIDVRLQRIDAQGAAQWGTDGLVVANTQFGQILYDLIPDGSGGVIVAFGDAAAAATIRIRAQRVGPNAALPWGPNGATVSLMPGNRYDARLVSDGAGGAIVTWVDTRSGVADVFAQRVRFDGTVAWAAEGIPVNDLTGAQQHPVLTTDGAGGAIIAWEDPRGAVYGQRLDSDGNAAWAEDGAMLGDSPGSVIAPRIVSDGFGGAVVAWSNSGANANVYAQRVDASGAGLWTAAGVVICDELGTQNEAELVADGAGGAFVVWEDRRLTDDPDLYMQRLDGTGALLSGPDGTLLCGAVRWQVDPVVAALGDGAVLTAWTDMRTGARSGIRGARFTPAVVGVEPPAVSGLALAPARPNPSSGALSVEFTLPRAAHVRLALYDVAGRRVRDLLDESRAAGPQRAFVDLAAGGVAPANGVYLLRLDADGESRVRRVTVLR